MSNIIDIFNNTLFNHRDKIVSIENGLHYTYSSLNARSNLIAKKLSPQGKSDPGYCAIFLPRSFDYLTAIWGSIKANKTFVPIDVNLPLKRILHIFEISPPSFLVTKKEYIEKIPRFISKDRIISIDDLSESVNNDVDFTWLKKRNNDSPLYCFFTSGSTGYPKGVLISENNFINFCNSMSKIIGFNSENRFLSLTNTSFDISLLEILYPTLIGASNLIIGGSKSNFIDYIWDEIESHQIDVIQATPSGWTLLTQSPYAGFSNTATLLTGGEPLHTPLANRLKQLSKNVWNMYGPTETTIWSLAWKVPDQFEKISIGLPILNTQLEITEEGELIIFGEGVGQGYIEATLEQKSKFKTNQDGVRSYATGDIVSKNQGELIFSGRKDDQVKINGFRIELNEISSILDQHPSIERSATILHNSENKKSIISFISLNQSENEKSGKWSNVWDNVYSDGDKKFDTNLNFSGWVNSFTGRLYSQNKMRSWRDATLSKIMAPFSESELKNLKVLDIGVGSGMILFELMNKVQSYYGIDASSIAINNLKKIIPNEVKNVQLKSIDIASLIKNNIGNFDLIIINSVLQYLGDIKLVERLLTWCTKNLNDEGIIYVGDVRNLHLNNHFHKLKSNKRSDLKVSFEESIHTDPELTIAPEFFINFGHQSGHHVSISMKSNQSLTEMTYFRFDIYIIKRTNFTASKNYTAVSFDEFNSKTKLEDILKVYSVPDGSTHLLDSYHYSHNDNQEYTPLPSVFDLYKEDFYILDDIDLVTKNGDHCVWLVNKSICSSLKQALVIQSDLSYKDSFQSSIFSNIPFDRESSQRGLIRDIHYFLSERLPSYSLPEGYQIVSSFHVTPSGKLDKTKLKVHRNRLITEQNSNFKSPNNSTQEKILKIWRKALIFYHIGISDNFFSIGGKSLTAIKVINMIKNELGVQVKLKDFYKFNTVEKLELLISSETKKDLFTSKIKKIVSDENKYPLSLIQQSLLGLSLMDEFNRAYNVPFVFYIQEPQKIETIEKKLINILSKSPLFYSNFLFEDNEFYARLNDPSKVFLKNFFTVDQDIHLQNFYDMPFDLKSNPPIRIAIFCKPDVTEIHFVIHHVACDTVTIDIIQKQLLDSFNESNTPGYISNSQELNQYDLNFHQQLNSNTMTKSMNYWSDKLKNAPDRTHFKLKDDTPFASISSKVESFCINEQDNQLISQICQHNNYSKSAFYLSILFSLLNKTNSQDDYIIGTPTIGRNRIESEQIAGCFINTLPIRVSHCFNNDFLSFLNTVNQELLHAFDNQNAPFPEIIKQLSPSNPYLFYPYFQLMLVYEEDHIPLENSNVDIKVEEKESSFSQYFITFRVIEKKNSVQVKAEYQSSRFTSSQIQSLLQSFNQLIKSVITNPLQKLSDIELTPSSIKKKILSQRKFSHSKSKELIALFDSAIDISTFIDQGHETLNDKESIVLKGNSSCSQSLSGFLNQANNCNFQYFLTNNEGLPISYCPSLHIVNNSQISIGHAIGDWILTIRDDSGLLLPFDIEGNLFLQKREISSNLIKLNLCGTLSKDFEIFISL